MDPVGSEQKAQALIMRIVYIFFMSRRAISVHGVIMFYADWYTQPRSFVLIWFIT